MTPALTVERLAAAVIVDRRRRRIVIQRQRGRSRCATTSGVDIYRLQSSSQRSNQNTCVNQRPLVSVGDIIASGDVHARMVRRPTSVTWLSAVTRSIAFMPWNGYNYEDSILMSERIVSDDVFTSIHIEEFDAMARDTKLGPEEITRRYSERFRSRR
ncbi:hypothetical protein ACE0DR_25590 [Azotobacter sp. CWF10]